MKPLPSAHFVVAHAEEGYTANVPISFLRDPLSLLATHADGEPLTPEHGGPLRLVIPGKYFWKSAKWLRGIELTRRTTGPASGSATGTTTTPIRSRRSDTASDPDRGIPRFPPEGGRDDRGVPTTTWVTQSSPVLPPRVAVPAATLLLWEHEGPVHAGPSHEASDLHGDCGRGRSDSHGCFGERRALLHRVAEVGARVAEGLVDVRLHVLDG